MSFKSSIRKLAPRAVRAHRIIGGPLKGRLIVTSFHDYPAAILGRTEAPLIAWFSQNVKPGQTWLDVGAHYGYTAIALAELVGPTGHVYAFEPSLSTAGYLNQTKRLNRLPQITVLPFGLGAPGNLRLMDVPTDRGMANHAQGGRESEEISVIGFDTLWNSLGDHPIHGVKVDVQGMEAEVLEGMVEALTNHRPRLVVEFHSGAVRSRISRALSCAGYRTIGTPIESNRAIADLGYLDDTSYVFESASNQSVAVDVEKALKQSGWEPR